MTGNKSYTQKGFSLLEILVAFSILAFSLGILLNIFSGGLRRTIVSEEYQQAVIIAQSKLAAAGIEGDLDDGNVEGIIQEIYFWSLLVEPLVIDDLDIESMQLTPYQVTARVEWSAGKTNRQVELTTIKLTAE